MGAYSLGFETGAVFAEAGQVTVNIANTSDSEERATILLMPGSLQQVDLDLPPQSIQGATISLPEGFKGSGSTTWLRIFVSSEQLVPAATFSDSTFGTLNYLPGDFAAFNFQAPGGKARLW
jgi:hypothetical protein